MRTLSRADLSIEEKVYMASATISSEGIYGRLSELSREKGISRQTLYSLGAETRQVLSEQFERQLFEPGGFSVWVDRRQVERAVIAMRAIGPNSIPIIQELMPVIYPGIKISYGTLWGIGSEAQKRAEQFNARMALDGIQAAAVDELFSQGQPVLSAIDLDSGVIVALKACASRSSDDWADVFEAAKKQGFAPPKFVKDAALGIAAGIDKVFPNAEQRDDAFHAKYEINKVLFRLGRNAYTAIEQEWKAARELEKLGKSGQKQLDVAKQNFELAQKQCQQAIELFDSFEKAARQAHEAMELVNMRTMQMRGSLEMHEELKQAASLMMALDESSCKKVGRYLHNRTEGLVLYAKETHAALLSLEPASFSTIKWATVLWQAAELLHRRCQPWARQIQLHALLEAWNQLSAQMHRGQIIALLQSIDLLFSKRHRASSAIEGFNATLRPHLYVHKSVSQGFLELFRAYYNLRISRSGPNKGSSAYQRLTGQRIEDWLSVLGYPPSKSQK